jgi:hypothetical protein
MVEKKNRITKNLSSITNLEQKDLVIQQECVPLSATIFCAEPRHKRIFTTIGAQRERILLFCN